MASVPRILKKWGAYASLRGAANKNTFYWEDLRRQDLDSGFKMCKKCYVGKRISQKCWELPFGGSRSQEVLAGWDPGNWVWAWMSGTVGRPGAACALPFLFFFQKAFGSALKAQTTHHVRCLLSLRGSKNTFCWGDVRCQDLDGGFRMSKKSYCTYRISKNNWEVPFGGFRSQIVFSRYIWTLAVPRMVEVCCSMVQQCRE